MRLADLDWVVYEFGTRASAPPVLPVATTRQIHSAIVLDANGQSGLIGEGDALISDTPGLAIGVKTADCFPILLADLQHRAVAAVHAGWRGGVQEITDRTLAVMQRRWNTKAEEVVAEIGPGIGPCCFEVGPEVAEQFVRWAPELAGADSKVNIDLAWIIRRQLVEVGVRADWISCVDDCTKCDAQSYYSFRREPENPGRMLSYVGISYPETRL